MKIPFFSSKKSSIVTFENLTNLLLTNDFMKLKREKDNGANFLLKDSYDGINILQYYIRYIESFNYDKKELVSFLLSCNIDINHKSNKRANENAALHLAVHNKNFDLIKILIDLNAEVEIQNKYGNTPLTQAIFNYRGDEVSKEIILYLINKGASLDKKNFHDVSPKEHILNVGGGIDAGFNNKDWDLSELL
jgi:ankyrin repeat protein